MQGIRIRKRINRIRKCRWRATWGGGEVDEKKGRGTVYRILKGRWKRRKKGRGEAERRGR